MAKIVNSVLCMAKIVNSVLCILILFILIHGSAGHEEGGTGIAPKASYGYEKTFVECFLWHKNCLMCSLNCDLSVKFCTLHNRMEAAATPAPSAEAAADG